MTLSTKRFRYSQPEIPKNEKVVKGLTRQRAAELVAKQKDFKDKEDLFDNFCMHFGFNSHAQIELFAKDCGMRNDKIMSRCKQCHDSFSEDDGYNGGWCCKDCYEQGQAHLTFR